jgi:hypothetical protein
MRILLFDIDGVLVKPFGYRKAYFDTCQWLINQGKLSVNLPAADIPALFESYGVTSEWDMLAITASILLNEVICKVDHKIEYRSLIAYLQNLASIPPVSVQIDFRIQITNISHTFKNNEIPSIGLLRSVNELLPALSNELAVELLGHTRTVKQAIITRVFQNFVLGGETFTKTYGMQPIIPCNSYLREFDKPLITMDMQKKLYEKFSAGENKFAALTARPSLQPRDFTGGQNVEYSPEAEMALDVIQMPDMPLIGYGRLQYIQSVSGLSADLLIKPDAFHAFAAIFTLLTESERAGVEAAAEIKRTGRLPEWIIRQIPEEIEISVFEDSQGGIRSVIAAAEELNGMGIKTAIHLFGITNNVDKQRPLKQLGAMIFPDINDALQYEFNI